MHYAFDEFQELISRLPKQFANGDPVVRYVCALVSELAYYHVPQFEIDDDRRAKVVPCGGYTDIVMTGEATDVIQYLRSLDFANVFVVIGRGIVAVGVKIKNLLFIGFRGTAFLYDWRINIRASMVDVPSVPWAALRGIPVFGIVGSCRVHRGFGEEAFRVTTRIRDELRTMGPIDHLFMTGHSLGGAVAALGENFIGQEACSTVIFGTPRYCDVASYCRSSLDPPTHIRRVDDIVPSVPPRRWGYADHPYQFDTSGDVMLEPKYNSGWMHWVWCACLLLRKGLRPHRMESYRRELGEIAKAKWSDQPLIPLENLKEEVLVDS